MTKPRRLPPAPESTGPQAERLRNWLISPHRPRPHLPRTTHPLGTEDWRQISQTMTKLGFCLNAIRLGCIQCTVQTFSASALNNYIYYYYCVGAPG